MEAMIKNNIFLFLLSALYLLTPKKMKCWKENLLKAILVAHIF